MRDQDAGRVAADEDDAERASISITNSRLSDDLIRGVAAIAAELGETERRTQHMLDKGDLPGFKLAGRWYARRSRLLARFEQLEAENHRERNGGGPDVD